MVEGEAPPDAATAQLIGARPDPAVPGRRVRLDGVLAAVLGDARPPQVGRYRIERLVGAGGMGRVYRGHDPELDRPVAIKLLTATGERERFAREAKLLRTIVHPAVVGYFDDGTTADGTDYLVMEWLDGCDLAARLARGRLTVPAALAVIAAAAAGLGAAHAAGIIHRDVKPSNLFLVGERLDDVRVMDFGIARSTRASAGPRLTQTGAALGTPGYMAPEQLRGEHDPRTDIYGLGATLFECLAGRPPFVGEHPAAVMLAVVVEPAPSLAALAPDVPVAVDALVGRMLAKDVRDRPRDVAAVATEIAHLLADRAPTRALGLSRAERTPARPHAAPPAPTTDVLGRARELATIAGALAECADEELAQLVVVTGDAGAGKSAVVDAAGAAAANLDGWTCLRVRAAHGDAGVPYATIAALLAEAAGAAPVAALAPLAAQLAALEREVGRDPRAAADRVRLGWLELCDAWTARGPLAIVIDDGHHADLSSQTLVAAALDHLGDRALTVVVATRADRAVAVLAAAVPDGARTQVALAPLRPRSSARLAQAWAPTADDAARADAVRLAMGNPAHLRELCRAVATGRTISSASLAELVWHRLTTLDPEARRVLRAAAIVGRELWAGAVAAVLGVEPGDPLVRERLTALADDGLVRPSRHQRVPGDRQLEFVSDLVHLAAYGLCTDDDLARGHRAVATWLARTPGFGAAIHGHHLAAAGDLAGARPWLLAAARAALAGDDPAALDAALAQARTAVGDDHDPELAALTAHARFWRGDLVGASDALAEAIARTPVDQPAAAALRSQAITIAGQRGDNAQVAARCAELLALGPALDAHGVTGVCRAATQLFTIDRPAAEAALAALPPVDVDQLGGEAAAWWWRARASAAAGRSFDDAIDGFVRAHRAHLADGDARAAAQIAMYLGSYYAWAGAWDLARESIADALRVARRLRADYLVVWTTYTEAKLLVELAPVATARAALAAIVDAPLASPRIRAGALVYDAIAALRGGDAEAAAAIAPQATALAPAVATAATAVRVRALLALGRVADVTDAEAEALARAATAAARGAEFDELIRLADAELRWARDGSLAAAARAAAFITRTAATLADPMRRNAYLTGPHLVVRTLALADVDGVGG